MERSHRAIFLIVFLVLVILLALVLRGRAGAPLRGAALGGAGLVLGAAGGGRGSAFGGGADAPPPRHHPRDLHPLGIALERYARTLGPEHTLAVHPLDRDRYEALPARGGAARKGKLWSEFPTWQALRDDKKALAEYFAQRAEAINNPDFDWGPVLRELGPRLAENREHIGLVNVEADGRTLRLEACEASPIEVGTMASETAFAAVPAELVRKYAERPALYMFHTHPADPRGSPLPSSHDLSTALYLAAIGRFAGSVVVSRYGAIMYTMDWSGYKAVNQAKNWDLALSNLSHDVVAAHEAARSWSAHTLADYLAFYPRHRLLIVAWPSSEMVADGRRFTYLWNLETPIDHELIAEHRDDIIRQLDKTGSKIHQGPLRSAARPPGGDLGLD